MKYTVFGKTGLRVSQVALGTGNFGTGCGYGADPDAAQAVFNAYAEAGGNFIDTADVYQFGQSEELLGTLLQGRREDFVLATKFTNGAVPNAKDEWRRLSRTAVRSSTDPTRRLCATGPPCRSARGPGSVPPDPTGHTAFRQCPRSCSCLALPVCLALAAARVGLRPIARRARAATVSICWKDTITP